ncbi:transcription factor E2F7 [Polypterus senegalus]|uniref:transcription factor E2F7 n=1 Tax=Polypterus senegalus TaxID=55291 RepID=UPI00196499F4|nr:transcription factor E2F7 [Polypterus senegalus]
MEDSECLALKDLTPRKIKMDLVSESKQEQKENICTERTILTPLKADVSGFLARPKAFTPERVHITPVKQTDRPQGDPWTPTSNLKMLISAASPDIRDREMKKSLFRPIENEKDATFDNSQFDNIDDCTADEFEKQRPSRKLKSLGLLCQKFLALYPDYPISTEKTTISLDEVAANLGVERRRIYDIVNVLESLLLVSRVAKNQYCWHGRHKLSQTLETLHNMGKRQRYGEQMAQIQEKELKSRDPRKEGCLSEPHGELTDDMELDAEMTTGSACKRKDKSLRIMSQKFVMLFLVSKTKIVTLDVAAKILIEESQDASDQSKFKTKVRRLYDIANVLTSLGLIKKIHVTEERGRKPAFKWIGPGDFRSSSDIPKAAAILDNGSAVFEEHLDTRPQLALCGKQKMARHSSFNVIPTTTVIQRRVSSAPSSPRQAKALSPENDSCRQKVPNVTAVCKLKFEGNMINKHAARPLNLTPARCELPAVSALNYSTAVPSFGHPLPKTDLLYSALYPNGVMRCPPTVSSGLLTPPTDSAPFSTQSSLVYFPSLPPSPIFMVYGKGAPQSAHPGVEGQRSPTYTEAETHLKSGVLKRILIEEQEQEKEQTSKKQKIDKAHPGASQDRCLNERSGNILTQHIPNTSPEMTTTAESQMCASSPARVQSSPHKAHNGKTLKCTEGEVEEKDGDQLSPSRRLPTSHYLCMPSAAGLNGLNFLVPASHAGSSLALSPSRLASVAVPCVVLPSTALSSFPVIGGTLPGNDTGSVKLKISSAHFLFGAQPVVSSRSPDRPVCQDIPAAYTGNLQPEPDSSCGADNPKSPESMGRSFVFPRMYHEPPLTPKEVSSSSETFFQTPSTTINSASRKRFTRAPNRTGSCAQRRLEIGSHAAN